MKWKKYRNRKPSGISLVQLEGFAELGFNALGDDVEQVDLVAGAAEVCESPVHHEPAVAGGRGAGAGTEVVRERDASSCVRRHQAFAVAPVSVQDDHIFQVVMGLLLTVDATRGLHSSTLGSRQAYLEGHFVCFQVDFSDKNGRLS
jgi:hypothetical protein